MNATVRFPARLWACTPDLMGRPAAIRHWIHPDELIWGTFIGYWTIEGISYAMPAMVENEPVPAPYIIMSGEHFCPQPTLIIHAKTLLEVALS